MPIFFQKCSFSTIFDHFWSFLVIFDNFLKKIQNRYFDQKCFLIYSKSILSKKLFSKIIFKIFIFWSFLVIFWLFLTIFEFFGSKNEKKILPPVAQYYYEFFKPSMRSLRLKMRSRRFFFQKCSFLTIFGHFWPFFEKNSKLIF